MKEISQATSVEEKEKFLKALQNKSEHIKSVMGDFLKNTWAQKIQQFEHFIKGAQEDTFNNIPLNNHVQ